MSSADAQCSDGTAPPCRSVRGVDTNAFVVLPFVVSGPPSAQYLGASMVDLLHMALDGVGKMRIEYAPTTIRRLSQLSNPQDARTASGLALEIGAGRVIAGTVVAIGSDVRIRAQVFDALRGRVQYTVEGRATLDNVSVVVDSLASQILARRLVPPADRNRLSVGEYATKSPKALQAYLVARQHSRRGERRIVADSLKSALRHDPGFGLAHQLLLRTEGAEQGISGMSTDSIMKGARAHRARFPDRLKFMFDDARDSGNRFRQFGWAREAAARFPNDPDATFHLADQYFHIGLNLGEPRTAAIAAFRRAITHDDQDPELLQHFEGLMTEGADSAAAWAAFERCHAKAPAVCPNDIHLRAIFRREDPRRLAMGKDSLYWGNPASFLIRATPWDPAFGLAITDSFAQIQTSPGRSPNLRNNAYIVRSHVALARGQQDRAWSFLDSADAAFAPRPVFRMFYSIITGKRTAEAAAVRINPTNLAQTVVRAWWTAARTNESVETYLRALETEPRQSPALAAASATGLRGLVALRDGDTAKAIEWLTRARAMNAHAIGPIRALYPGAALALAHARIEAARGNHATAKLYLADLAPMNDYVSFIGEAEEFRAKVALSLGDSATARTHLRNVVAIWANADSLFQRRVTQARGTLANLGPP